VIRPRPSDSTPAPANELEMALPYTRSEAVVTLADGSKKTPANGGSVHVGIG
jgi:hypothetical protein